MIVYPNSGEAWDDTGGWTNEGHGVRDTGGGEWGDTGGGHGAGHTGGWTSDGRGVRDSGGGQRSVTGRSQGVEDRVNPTAAPTAIDTGSTVPQRANSTQSEGDGERRGGVSSCSGGGGGGSGGGPEHFGAMGREWVAEGAVAVDGHSKSNDERRSDVSVSSCCSGGGSGGGGGGAARFGAMAREWVAEGAVAVGGCCRVTLAHIAGVRRALRG